MLASSIHFTCLITKKPLHKLPLRPDSSRTEPAKQAGQFLEDREWWVGETDRGKDGKKSSAAVPGSSCRGWRCWVCLFNITYFSALEIFKVIII